MSQWQRFTRRDCPVCGGARNDCRQNLGTNLIHCRYSEANPIDYLFRGLDAWGFGLWAYKPDAEDWTDKRREEWRQLQKLERETQKRQLEQQRSALLNESERDRVIKTILSQLTLTNRHREALHQRELTDEEIERGGFRSVSQWQKLDFPVNDGLAGVKLGGRSLLTPDSGILCPIPNYRGEWVGWQLRRDNPDDGGKYIWASGDKRLNPKPSSHLPNGELPITVYLPQGNQLTGIVGLTEGTSIKPYITSLKLNITVLGAAGGNFASSPKTLKQSLEALGASIVRLYPDAGSALNPHVLTQYTKTFNLLEEWGYFVEVAWWGQVEKNTGDIDEIGGDAIASIQYLTPENFLELAQHEQHQKKVAQAQKKLNSLTYLIDLRLDQPYLNTELVSQLPGSGIINIKSAKGTGKSSGVIKPLIECYRSKGYSIISITPRIALGRGQSLEWGIDWIDDSQAPEINHLTFLENQSTIGLCWDSLGRLYGRDWSKTVVIIDEVELGISHLATSSTCKDRRSFILRTFQEKIKECLENNGLVILSDADLTDISVDYTKALAPNSPVFTVVNVAKPKPWDIDFYTGKVDEIIDQIFEDVEAGQKIAIATDSQAQAEALDRKLSQKFPDKRIIRVDGKTTEEDYVKGFVARPNDSILEEKPDILIYTSSMGTGVSIDISGAFDTVYGLFYGVLEPSQCRQMLARVREPIKRVIWAKEASYFDDGCRSFLPEVIKKQLWRFNDQGLNMIDLAKSIAGEEADDFALLETLNGIMNSQTRTWDNPHIDLYSKLRARRNFGLSQLAVQLRQELIEEGHNLTDWACEDSTALGDAVNATKEMIAFEEATAIATAADITLEQATAIKRRPNCTEEERARATKAFLKAELPGVELTPKFVDKAIVKDKRRWLNRVKLFWHSQNREKTKELDRTEWRHKLKQFSKGVVFLSDLKTYSTKVKVLEDLRLFDLIDLDNPNKDYTATDQEVIKFLERAFFMRYRIYTAFNLTVTKKTDSMALIDRLLKRVGLKLKSRQARIDGNRVRFYWLNPDLLYDGDRIAVLNSLDKKYSTTQTEQGSQVSQHFGKSYINSECCDGDSPLKNSQISKLSIVKQLKNGDLQTQSQQDDKGVTALANGVNNNGSAVTEEDGTNDPFSGFQVGDRVYLWHPSPQDWMAATITRVIGGVKGFIHVARNDGHGLLVEANRLNWIALESGYRRYSKSSP